MMRSMLAAVAFGLLLAGGPPAQAAPETIVAAAAGIPQNAEFRRCMRAKYGPRYFARVPRAHRWHMSQACMA